MKQIQFLTLLKRTKTIFAASANLLLCLLISVSEAATVPNGFSDTQVVSGLSNPTAMAFAPDGRLFVCLQGGSLRVIKNGQLLAQPFLTVTVNSSGERGLLGVAFDPEFETNQYVYIYYTATSPAIHNRISRFTANGDVAVSNSEVIILELNNLSSATNHNGGALHFGPDGKLYAAVGENATSSNSQTLNNLLGKMLRLNKDGTIPTDNPFYNQASGNNRAIWAMGLRNPFTFDFQPGSGRMFINDVGAGTWEEINDGIAGSNYGWPNAEGPVNCGTYTCPIFAYGHGSSGTTGCAITGGAFYNPPVPQFPSEYTGDYFFADYCSGWIRVLETSTNTASNFATGISLPVDLKVFSDGSLYYLARGSNSVNRIEYTANQAPSITTHPSDQTVTTGQNAVFTVTATGTPPLQYQWQRNSLDINGATSSTYTLSNSQLSDDGDLFRCVVTNDFGNATSNDALLTVTANNPPSGTITQPNNGTLYDAGDTINYSGTASDPEDGDIPAGGFTWQVDFHHDTHTHPFVPPTSGSQSGSFVIPTIGETDDNQWYRIYLTVTDSGGLTDTTYVEIFPRKSTITLDSNPAGLELRLDGQSVIAPYAFVGVVGMTRNIEAVSPQSSGGTTWNFVSWSDSGAISHDISTPLVDTTYVATFTSAPACTEETASQTGILTAKDNTLISTMTPSLSISSGNAGSALLSWSLGGNTDLTGCVNIRLRAPNSSETVVKAAGVPDPGNADVTSFYITHGPGTYSIQLQELAGCGGRGNRKAELSLTQMTVSEAGSCGCSAPAGLPNNTATDADPCSDSGVLVTWPVDPGSWGDDGSGSRTYDVLRDGSPIAIGLGYGTTSFTDTTGVNGNSYNYSIRYKNGCGASATTDGEQAADQIGGSSQSEIADQSGVLEQRDDTGNSPLTPSFSISGGAATSASISWNLAGNTDLTACTEIRLRAPDTSEIVLKPAGSPDPSSANVLSFYSVEGPGMYRIVLTELPDCGGPGRKKAQLSATQMVVQQADSCN